MKTDRDWLIFFAIGCFIAALGFLFAFDWRLGLAVVSAKLGFLLIWMANHV